MFEEIPVYKDENKHWEDRIAHCQTNEQRIYVISSVLSKFESKISDLESEINLLRHEAGLI